MVMSRNKNRPAEVCADCNCSEPSWASVNRGVYLCNECAGVHRTLGRHVSQVKHLHKSEWHPNQLSMLHQLVSFGANSIWEHSLLDPAQMRSGKRKPNPSDSVHPIKSEFIRAKYEQLAFVHRPTRRDDEDLAKQLHSSVRTANLDTSLRLLSLGAQPNFFHSERGNTPLHNAAKAGQVLQVELLVTYGADPAGLDVNRQTPENLARFEGHHDLADRLVELQYELSDRLAYFAWGIKPDHKQKNHYPLQKGKDNGVGVDGKKRLQALSNQIFEELAMDVYDEVDRRETDRLWQEAKHGGPGKAPPIADNMAVPFLTVHPEYSATRNQGRQKLARFKNQELCVLISDILYDIVRRQSPSGGIINFSQATSSVNHNQTVEDPIYDLPPDENLDYQSIENQTVRPNQTQGNSVSMKEYLALKQKFEEKKEEVCTLQEQNRVLSNKVTDLAKQNHELIKQKQYNSSNSAFKATSKQKPQSSVARSNSTNTPRPISVLNAMEFAGSQTSLGSSDSIEQRRRTIHVPPHEEIVSHKDHAKISNNQDKDKTKKPILAKPASPHNSFGSDYDNNVALELSRKKENSAPIDGASEKTLRKNFPESFNSNESNNTASEKLQQADINTRVSPVTSCGDSKSTSEKAQEQSVGAKNLPKADEVIRKTEAITKNIQNLLQAAQKGKVENYFTCSENTLITVKEIISLFPEDPESKELASIINNLGASAEKLKSRCQNVSEEDAAVNVKQVTEEIIKKCYDVAKAAKELVTMTNKLQTPNSSS